MAKRRSDCLDLGTFEQGFIITFLTGNVQDAFGGAIGARAEQTAWRCHTHSAVVRGLV